MPSFSAAEQEQFRHNYINRPPSTEAEMSKWTMEQVEQTLEVAAGELREEYRRLEEAENQVRESQANLPKLHAILAAVRVHHGQRHKS